MAQPTYEEMLAEARKRGLPVSSESVLEPESGAFDEFKKVAESTLKGSARGIIDLFGGWGNLYDYLKKSGEPSALSSAGMVGALEKATGVDLGQIQGYKGAYQFGQAAGPQVAISTLMPGAALAPRLMARSPVAGAAFEGGVAGGASLLAQQVAPDSPLAQFVLQSAPYAVSGAGQYYRGKLTQPIGTVTPEATDLLNVGPLTPGEATGSRRQLAKEAEVEVSPAIEQRGTAFRRAQAESVQAYLDKLFDKASSKAVTPEQATTTIYTSFDNYGKSLSRKLTSSARADFNAAKKAGGLVDTTPVVDAVREYINKIPPETPGLDGLKAKLSEILDVYVTPAQPATATPSAIVNVSGQPAFTNVTQAVPEQITKIDIDRLQKNLSAWGEAVYSGKADFGKGNIFEGVAPGQVRGIALEVLRGFRTSLDDAIAQGVPGAAELKQARDKFKANLADIEEFSVRPLTRYFDVPNAAALTPEKVVQKLKTSEPSERAFLGKVLQNNAQAVEVWDTVRRSYFDDVLSKATNTAAAKNEPTLVLNKVLSGLNKEGDLAFLFPNPNDLAAAKKAILYMQTVGQSATSGGGASFAANKAYETARAGGGSVQAGNAARLVIDAINTLIASPVQFSQVIFDTEAVNKLAALQSRTTPQKYMDAAKALLAVSARTAARSGPRVSGVGAEQLVPETAQPMEEEGAVGVDYDALEQEARRRGLLQ